MPLSDGLYALIYSPDIAWLAQLVYCRKAVNILGLGTCHTELKQHII